MGKDRNSFYILHVSDFHISEESKEDAENALKVLTDKLKKMNINISYLMHTGDVINSEDLERKIETKYGKELNNKEYDMYLEKMVTNRFEDAETVMNSLIRSLDVKHRKIVICCGNHDKVRYKQTDKNKFEQFENFLEKINGCKELTSLQELDDLNVLILNTNISDDKKITCIDCQKLKKILNKESEKEVNWFYTYNNGVRTIDGRKKVNIIVAHQPLYDICEHIRLPYGAETQTTDFLSMLQEFVNGNGIYLCGDKHTSSITATYIHDIPHYLCGCPFVFKKPYIPNGCTQKSVFEKVKKEIDYNLIEIRNGQIGQIRKLHLYQDDKNEWKCKICPIDFLVSELYEKSRDYIARNSFALLAMQSGMSYSSWINLSWHNLFNRLGKSINSNEFQKISDFYSLCCRIKGNYDEIIEWDEKINIFSKLCEIISDCFKNNSFSTNNIINIRGDYSSGKSTFLGVLYIFLLYCYNYEEINYIPAYFNMENDEILNKIQEGSTYSSAVKQIFSEFVLSIEKIAKIEQVPVCYIIDGLDEQDIWSESTQDSIGRVALDVLSETKNSKYIMSFCQNKLACFKNTMPAIKYYEKNYVIYFNSVSVKEKGEKSANFAKFVRYIVTPQSDAEANIDKKVSESIKELANFDEPDECSAIRKLRRLSVNQGFIYHNYQYLKECGDKDSVNMLYMRYIDQQHQICMDVLGYGFVHYAPAMAYLFT